MEIEDFIAKLDGVRQLPSGISARCPAHDDHVASLSVGSGEAGGVVVHCHAGCAPDQVVAAMGLTMTDLAGLPHVVAEYGYWDNQGRLHYTVERWANPKTFRCRPGLPPPAQRILYNMPAVEWVRAVPGFPYLYVVEGEKDCDKLAELGIPATTNVGGAGKWLPQYTETLRGLNVIIVADNDVPGRAHAREVAAQLRPVCASVRLTHSKVGKDIADALDAGYDLGVLEPLTDFEDIGSYLASSIQIRKVEWAWADYIPLGKLSMIEGDPGDGKSILTTDLAARWSTGAPMPDGTNGAGPWPVILVSAEDEPDDTVVPRLLAAGANMENVHLVPHGLRPDLPFEFSDGLPAIADLVRRTGARAVFFDPLMAFLSGVTDSHNDASVRRALQPLRMMASQTGAAVVVVRHLNKGGSGTKAIYRGGGSIGFTGAARATYLVTAAPDDPKTRIFACVKNNLAAKPPSLTYTVEITQQGVPYVAWGGSIDLNAQDALDGPRRTEYEESEDTRSTRRMRRMAGDFLLELLSDGPLSWREIVEAGKEEGHSQATLVRARAEVALTKLTGPEGRRSTSWATPTTPPEAPFTHLLTENMSSPKVENGEQMGKWENGEDDEDREARLDAAPLECSVCHTDVNVCRYAAPFWVIRCDSHDPRTYGGQ